MATHRWHRRTPTTRGRILLDYLRAQRQGPPTYGHTCRTIQITMPRMMMNMGPDPHQTSGLGQALAASYARHVDTAAIAHSMLQRSRQMRG